MPGAASSGLYPAALTPFGGKLYFAGSDSAGRTGLWATDGTAAGTQELHAPGALANFSPDGLVPLGGQVLFDGIDASGVSRFWTSGGTSAGTSVLLPGPITVQGGYTSISASVRGPASPSVRGPASPNFAWTDTTTSAVSSAGGEAYTGPVSYLKWQFLWSGTDSVNLDANADSVFLRGGSGTDALQATSGSNVLDGGTGSNFLVGANGYDGGTDTFFIDARGGNVTWSTLTNFHPGDAVTFWGFTGGTSAMAWAASDGAAGYQGATIHAATAGAGTDVNGSVTFAGVSLADAQSKFAISTGSIGGNDFLYVRYAA